MMALQRLVGNEAVTRRIQEQRRAHEAREARESRDGQAGHGPAVQRAVGSPTKWWNDATVRVFGPEAGQLMNPVEEDQEALNRVFPRRTFRNEYRHFPDPVAFTLGQLTGQLTKYLNSRDDTLEAADWVKAINPRRDESRAYRRNCIDAARSFLASWSGNPTVAVGVNGTTDEDAERDGPKHTSAWLNTNWRSTPAEPDKSAGDRWKMVENQLKRAGHGALTIVVFQRIPEPGKNPTNHAVCAVNYKGQIVWVDPQMGRISATPMYEGRYFMWITLDSTLKVFEPAPSLFGTP